MKVREPETYKLTKKGLDAYRRGELVGDPEIVSHIVSVLLSGSSIWGLPESTLYPILLSWTRRGYISTDPSYLKDLDNFYNSLDSGRFGKNVRFSRKSPEVIYCASSSSSIPYLSKSLGFKSGVQLPDTVYSRLDFADQDWKKPQKERYIKSIKEHRPTKATVLDATSKSRLKEALEWAEEIAPYVEEIIVIPKYSGAIQQVPEFIKGKKVLLGYSVPTTYGSTDVPLKDFGDRPVHLLGGQPHTQMDLARKLNVESVDFNSVNRQSTYGHSWVNERVKGSSGKHDASLKEMRDAGLISDYGYTNIPGKALEISLLNVRKAWGENEG